MEKVMEPDDEWKAFIAAHLEWVDGWINPGSESKFKGPEGRIKLLQLIIDSNEIAKEEAVKLQCLGTYLGQAIVEKTGWPWKVIEDEYGTDLAIQIPDRKVWIFPVTMISKRIEDGDLVDVEELFNGVIPLALQVNAARSDGTSSVQ
ncbi:MAG: DUF3806 domain-containing protein [Pseudomonadota bacterium]